MKHETAPKGGSASCAGHVTTFVDLPATVGALLLQAEIDLKVTARRIEWCAVTHPELQRTARLAYHAARRLRGDRLAVAA